MKKTILFSTALLFSAAAVCQKKVTIKPIYSNERIETSIRIAEVIDARQNKTSTWTTYKGIANKPTDLVLSDSLDEFILDYVHKLHQPTDLSFDAVLVVHEFNIEEIPHKVDHDVGICVMQYEICVPNGDSLFSIFIRDKIRKDVYTDVSSRHKNRVAQILEDLSLHTKALESDMPVLRRYTRTNIPSPNMYDFDLTDGIYQSYSEMIYGLKLDIDSFNLIDTEPDKPFSLYTLNTKPEIDRSNIRFIVQNGEIFRVAPSTEGEGYMRNRTPGKYLAFRLHEVDPTILPASLNSLILSTIKFTFTYFYDPDRLELRALNRDNLLEIASDFPDIQDSINKSKLKTEDEIEFVDQINTLVNATHR